MNASHHPLDNQLLLGRYRVMRLLGEGGMGTVHLARVEGAEGFTRPVVVKRMRRDVRATEEGNRLFIREAKILSKLQHPGIVGISDFGIEDGAHIMVLDYVHGYTLSAWLAYRQRLKIPIPVDVCLYIMRRVLDALHYAHCFNVEEGQETEIVHRDVAPDNVLLSNKGYVHLLDFGVASMSGPQAQGATNSGAFRGKLCYAAPETVMGQPATPRSDQYSAAVVLLELLTGTMPFQSNSVAETFARMVSDIPEPPSAVRDDVPPQLDAAIARALAKDPAVRFDSALAFSRELRRIQHEDDEDVAERLKALVHTEFELLPDEVDVEALKDRESALERIVSLPPSLKQTLLGGHQGSPGEPTGAVDVQGTTLRADTPGVAAPIAAPAQQRQIQGLLWGILGVGGLIAVGLGATVAVLARSGSNAEQVVVVGGNRPEEPNRAETFSSAPAATNLEGASDQISAASQGVAAAQSEHPNAGTRSALQVNGIQASQNGSRLDARPSEASGTPAANNKAQLSRAVQQKSGAYQACFAQHLSQTKQAPEAVLHFSVAKQGGTAQVNVEPSGLAATPLGSCLAGAARQVQFPALEQPVSFRVPVRARVSNTKDSK